MIFGCRFGFFDTYISGLQVRVTTRTKLVLANIFNSCIGRLRCVRDPNQLLKYVSRCTKFDIKTSNNKAYHYILECIAYLLFQLVVSFLIFSGPSLFHLPPRLSTPQMESLEGAHTQGSFQGEPYTGLIQSSNVFYPSVGPSMNRRYLF